MRYCLFFSKFAIKYVIMEDKIIKSVIKVCQIDELTTDEAALINAAIKATDHSYSPYSHFSVGAAVMLDNGLIIPGCNQENAAFGVTICAERSALFTAGASHPLNNVAAIAIAAKDENGLLLDEPITPCGSCRQALIEAEKRYGHKIPIFLYGKKYIYAIEGIGQLMPLSFTTYS